MSVLPQVFTSLHVPTAGRGRSPMRPVSRYTKALREHQAHAMQWGRLESATLEAAERLAACLSAGGKVLLCGQGSAATLCRQVAAWLAGQTLTARAPMAVLALATDQVAWPDGSDNGYTRQVEALGRPGDALVVICTGEGWLALKRAADRAGERGLLTLGLLAPESRGLSESCHLAISVPGGELARVQEAQQFIAHALCDLIDSARA